MDDDGSLIEIVEDKDTPAKFIVPSWYEEQVMIIPPVASWRERHPKNVANASDPPPNPRLRSRSGEGPRVLFLPPNLLAPSGEQIRRGINRRR